MANGERVHEGAVAVSFGNYSRLKGTSWRVIEATWPDLVGRVFVVSDKGSRAHFDMWTGDCQRARNYGGHTIKVERVS